MNDVAMYDPVCRKFFNSGNMKSLEDISKKIQELVEKDESRLITWGDVLEEAFEIPRLDIPDSCYTIGWLRKEG